ncbi:hypothetical protein GCM10027343_33330 [Noviherbaspirillum agri]
MIQALAVTFSSLLFIASFIALVRKLSGWARLEGHYACSESEARDESSVAAYHGVSASARFARMSLSVELNRCGMRLAPSFPFSDAMKAVDIPWSAVDEVWVRRGLFGERTVIRIRHADVPISVKGRAGKRILEFLSAQQGMAHTASSPESPAGHAKD